MKSRWIDRIRKRIDPWRVARPVTPAHRIRIRVLLVILLGVALALLGVQARNRMSGNLGMARLIRHAEGLRGEAATRSDVLKKIDLYAIHAQDPAATEKIKTEQMETLVRCLRSHRLEILSFQAERKNEPHGVVIELNLSVSGVFPDLVKALDEIGSGRPAWLAGRYRIRLTGQERVRLDGIFHMLVNGGL